MRRVTAAVSNTRPVRPVRRQRACPRTSIESPWELFEFLYSQSRPDRTVAADDGGRTIATAPDIMRADRTRFGRRASAKGRPNLATAAAIAACPVSFNLATDVFPSSQVHK
jgi:hypothetical protein